MDLLFLVLLDVLVDGLREFEIAIDVAAIGVVGVREDGEFLLRLSGEDAIAPGRVVVAAFYLAQQGGSFFGIGAGVFREPLEHCFSGQEVVRNHGEDEPAVVADVLAGVERVEKVIHHGLAAESSYCLLFIG